jgi:hypothetical protein
VKNKKNSKCELNLNRSDLWGKKGTEELMNFDIACWKLILKIYRDDGNNTR